MATACSRATKCATGAQRQTNWSQDWNRDGRVDNFDAQIAQRYRGLRHEQRQPGRTQRVAWRRAAFHPTRHQPRWLSHDAGIHAGRRFQPRLTRRSGVPLLEHRCEPRRLGDPQRMAHGQHRLQPSRHQSRQPDQPLRVRDRHRERQRRPAIRSDSSTRTTPTATAG